jgi:enterochelin esterase-like enzyme
MIRILLCLACSLGCTSPRRTGAAGAPTAPGAVRSLPVPESPRLAALEKDLASGVAGALDAFWAEMGRSGSPLVESPAGTPEHERLVTFLWRSEADTRVVLLTDFGESVPQMTLERLPGTDVGYRSFHLPVDARFLYEISVDDPAYPFVDGETVRYPTATRPDPLNPHRWEFGKPSRVMSLVELPEAPSLELSTPNPDVPHGVCGRFGQPFKSAILGNERDVFVYRPPLYSDSGEPYPLLIFGASYLNQIRLPVILDNLVARHRIPPVVAVFVGFPPSPPGQNVQDEEAGGEKPFADFITTELLPWVREHVHVTRDPRRVVIGGASAGGHSAACVALQHPEAIGNVIAQSGAFWRGIGHTAHYWNDPARDEGREGFAHTVASIPGSAPVPPVRYYLTIGRLERGHMFGGDTISMVHASRHVRDVLQAKGHEVTLRETDGGHDPYNWEVTLAEALVALLGEPATGTSNR